MKNFRILFTDRPSVDVKWKTPFTVARRFFGKRNMEIRGYVDHGNLREYTFTSPKGSVLCKIIEYN